MFVYLLLQVNQAKHFMYFAIHMIKLEYIGNNTVSKMANSSKVGNQ